MFFIDLDNRTKMYDTVLMNGNEFIKRLRKIAKAGKMNMKIIKGQGKGSHFTLYLDSKKTTIKDRKKEIGPGLLNAMLDQLGINKKDFE